MIARLMSRISETYQEGGDWCSLEKAQTLAAIVIALRPTVICEIGVWMGGSLIPMAMALRALREVDEDAGRHTKDHRVIAIDAWSAEDSCVGQGEADAAWWATVDHEGALSTFRKRLAQHGLAEICQVVQTRSDDAPVPASIDLLHVDGNHADQALRDVVRFAPAVPVGGILVLDDVFWHGGHVRRAYALAEETGFRPLYPLGTGTVMQRASRGPRGTSGEEG
jgi:predicted O-methyltransferase YrrM